ncbi:ceramide synthase 1 [Trichonephila inaurata madagascariensis]|uniref:Ceramide synthase 1 n=1 Tax=Trichonephila inaurata madagascariensis TaxID=2747483 RepID=A0A8X7BWM6_9ARAC|nr:ceramide synthase 1 [Trichonephila inaurata madagascariensis]
MAAADTDWENFPSYSDLWRGIREFLDYVNSDTFVEGKETFHVESTWQSCNFNIYDMLFIIVLAIIWTILRHFATEGIFKPLARHYALTPTNQAKMPESAWKFTYYLCAWSYALYVVVLSGNYMFFQKPSTVWDNWSLRESPPMDIYVMYMAQCGFYIHSLYATLFLDTWRKDSLVMMIHHVLTVTLISISYSLRYHNIGSLVLFTHDACDILLEYTKLNVYFKIQGGKLKRRHEIFANISFFCFTVAWYVCRLYWYPLRVLYTATSDVQRMKLVLPGALLMNSLLWILQILNIYWFLFILQFLFRVATGQVKEVDDTREYDVEEKLIQTSKTHSTKNGLVNGNVKANGSCDDGVVLNGNVAGTPSIREKKD